MPALPPLAGRALDRETVDPKEGEEGGEEDAKDDAHDDADAPVVAAYGLSLHEQGGPIPGTLEKPVCDGAHVNMRPVNAGFRGGASLTARRRGVESPGQGRWDIHPPGRLPIFRRYPCGVMY